jgi:Protein of unknown function (DUF2510)
LRTVAQPDVPAGWYPDPEQAQTQRYWDGSDWTDQRAPLPPSKPEAVSFTLTDDQRWSVVVLLAGACLVGVSQFHIWPLLVGPLLLGGFGIFAAKTSSQRGLAIIMLIMAALGIALMVVTLHEEAHRHVEYHRYIRPGY